MKELQSKDGKYRLKAIPQKAGNIMLMLSFLIEIILSRGFLFLLWLPNSANGKLILMNMMMAAFLLLTLRIISRWLVINQMQEDIYMEWEEHGDLMIMIILIISDLHSDILNILHGEKKEKEKGEESKREEGGIDNGEQCSISKDRKPHR